MPFVANTRTPLVPTSPSLTSLEAVRSGAYFKTCNFELLCMSKFTLQIYDRLIIENFRVESENCCKSTKCDLKNPCTSYIVTGGGAKKT